MTTVDNADKDAPDFRFLFSDGLAEFLAVSGVSLLATTYQAGRLMAVRSAQGRVSTLLRSFDRPMGLAWDGARLALGTRNAVWFFRNAADIASQLEPPGAHDACFLPRSCHVTGDIRGHEMAWSDRELWIVNTRFSCLCSLTEEYSFMPRWRPRFITQLAAEDRCHLNGLAMADGRPKYVTALGETDMAEGWRPAKADGGVLIDVSSDEIIARGFAMPHSPRIHQGSLFVLDSGRGQLQIVDPANGSRQTVAAFPGYARGLAFHQHVAFVGISRIREKKEFGGLPIEARAKDLRCGIHAIDLRTGQPVGVLEFERGCDEIFAVEVLSNIRWPEIVGFKEETVNHAFVVPIRRDLG